jgi:hypothetical protein
MESFGLYVGGHRSRLTAAGWSVLVTSAVTSAGLALAAVGLTNGTRPVIRLGPGAAVISVVLVAGCGEIIIWSAATLLCRLAGVPMVTPEVHRERSRRPFQFTLGGLQAVVIVVAVLCAVPHLDLVQVGKFVYLASMLMVITLGTAVVVARRITLSLRVGMVRGGLAGSCLSAVCLGWMFVVYWVIEPGIRPLFMLASVTALGGLLGVLVGLAMVVWLRWRLGLRGKALIHIPPAPPSLLGKYSYKFSYRYNSRRN